MPIKTSILKPFAGPLYIETGAWEGDGVEEALQAGFERVISIEFGQKCYEKCVKRFKDDPRVQMVLGDSGVVLAEVLQEITQPAVLFLDAHFCGDEGGGSMEQGSVLDKELGVLLQHPIKTHTILVDDIRCFKTGDWKFDGVLIKGAEAVAAIEAKIRRINPAYQISYLDGGFPERYRSTSTFPSDILLAKI